MAESKPIEIWVQLAALAVVISAGCLYVLWHDGATETSPIAAPVTGDELPVPTASMVGTTDSVR